MDNGTSSRTLDGQRRGMPLLECLEWISEAAMISLLLLAIFTPAWAGDGASATLLVAAAPGASMPALALVDYGAGRQAIVLYPGGKADAQALSHELRKHGVAEVEALMVPAYSPCHKGAEVILEGFPVGRAVLTGKSRSPADFGALATAADEGRITLSRVQPRTEGKAMAWTQAIDGWEWSFRRWGSGSCRCVLKRLCMGVGKADGLECRMDAYPTGEFVVTLNDGKERKERKGRRLLVLPRCSVVQLRRLKLDNEMELSFRTGLNPPDAETVAQEPEMGEDLE